MHIKTRGEQNKPQDYKMGGKKHVSKLEYFLFLGLVLFMTEKLHDKNFPNFLYIYLLHHRFMK